MDQYSNLVQQLILKLTSSPEFEQIRAYNTKMQKWNAFFLLLVFIPTGLFVAMYYTSFAEGFEVHVAIALAASIVLLLIFTILTSGRSKRNTALYKHMVVEDLVRKIDDHYKYQPSEKIGEQDFNDAHLFYSSQNRYSGSDLFTANIDSVRVSFSDLNVSHRESRGKRGGVRDVNVFTGQFYTFESGQIRTQGNIFFVRDKVGFIANSLDKLKLKVGIKDRGEVLPIPDPALESKFRLIAEVPAEGQSFYQKFTPIITFLRNKNIEASFAFSIVNGKFYLAVDNPYSRFEHFLAKDMLSPELLQTYVDDFCSSKELVDFIVSQLKTW